MNASTFEEVDKQVAAADLSAHQKASAAATAAIPDLCAIYRVVRPILDLLVSTPLLPAKWREALKIFMQIADKLCPGT